MGRGRAKAKQTKVARDLKYRTPEFDSASLERELRGESGQIEDIRDQVPDQYADLISPYDEDDLVAYDDDEDRR